MSRSYKTNYRDFFGGKNNSNKIEAKRLYKSGKTPRQIAKILNCDLHTVLLLSIREKWKDSLLIYDLST